ncbi:MAG: hypothetical protein IK062_10490 [Selenomonadaceae bacterium]|nr:hypothetical protein [Selenomonadaceae bacterium]
MKKFFNERGLMLFNVIFLTLITSFAGMIVLNGMKKNENYNAELKIIALYLAEEQFAELESLAAEGNLTAGGKSFLGDTDDLKNYLYENDKKINSQIPINFEVDTNVSSYSSRLYRAEVKVSWTFKGEKKFVELKKNILQKNVS